MNVARYILLALMVMMLCGFTSCSVQRHQKGGGATTTTQMGPNPVAPMQPQARPDRVGPNPVTQSPARKSTIVNKAKLPDNVRVINQPGLSMGISQPENPEGSSSMESKQTTTTIYPDGVVVVSNIETATEIGGSQDYAKILKEYSQSNYFKNLLAGLGMMLAAWWMYKKEWEMTAATLFIAGIFCVFWSWWAAPIGIGAAFLMAGGHYKTLAAKILT